MLLYPRAPTIYMLMNQNDNIVRQDTHFTLPVESFSVWVNPNTTNKLPRTRMFGASLPSSLFPNLTNQEGKQLHYEKTYFKDGLNHAFTRNK
ncbi:hypothetical protein C7460_11791 [Marinoscillum furvescens DSM 4134]|uniref:Uncharacterized protein n=1 Tax=Marinoscillum furvescens DSM 4134 TaxID=1122208 RepID=A0A3D9L0E7_MARFU|nr:hypothetical protein C7460_11791 [Marinoscillum furvescens DSM 4134]